MINLLEIGATIFGLIQGFLAMLNKRSNWIAYSIQMILMVMFSLSMHLYGDVLNNSFYLIIGIIGFIMGILLLVINLCSIKTFNKPYTVPIFPFMFSEQGNAILRKDIKSLNKRPSYVTKKNIFRKG